MHLIFLGSGSHSPFPIHVDVVGPVRTNSGGQLNVALVLCGIICGSIAPLYNYWIRFHKKSKKRTVLH